jgi:4-amino-4-deoxy-L-arabinose transferase-like glycosyltransferase
MAPRVEPTCDNGDGHVFAVTAASHRAQALVPLAGVAALFVLTRLALLRRFPPFLDESLYATWALRVHDSVNDRFVALAYGKLPLLSWLGAGFVFAGIEPLDAVRLVSIAAGLASMVVAGLLATRLGGRRAGLAAVALYAVLPLAVVHDVIGIMEPLVAALLALSLYLQVRLAERPAWATSFLLGLAMAGGLLTKETGRIALVLFPLSLLVFDWRDEGRSRRLLAWLGCAASAVVIAGSGYLILTLSEYWDDYPQAREALGTFRGFGDGISHPLRWLESTWSEYRTELIGYTTMLVLLAVVVGVAVALRRHVRLACLYVVWLIAVLAIDVLFLPNPFARYLVPLSPLLAAFGGYGILWCAEAIARALRRPQDPLVMIMVGLVVLLPALVFDARVLASPSTAPYPGLSREEYATGWAAGTGWGALADELRRRAMGEPIVVASYSGLSEALPLLLRHDTDIQIVRGQGGDTGPEATADYVIENGSSGTGLPEDTGYGVLRPIWTFQRPAAGAPIVLYRRGVEWKGRFYETPDALRAGLGLPDPAFDRFIAAHPEIRAWYVAKSSSGP